MKKDKIKVLYRLKVGKSIFDQQFEVSELPKLGANDTFTMNVAGQLFVPKGTEEIRSWEKESPSTYEYIVTWGLKDSGLFIKKQSSEELFKVAIQKEGYTLVTK